MKKNEISIVLQIINNKFIFWKLSTNCENCVILDKKANNPISANPAISPAIINFIMPESKTFNTLIESTNERKCDLWLVSYLVVIGISIIWYFVFLIFMSIFISYSNLAPLTDKTQGIISLEKARSPLCVSFNFIPYNKENKKSSVKIYEK